MSKNQVPASFDWSALEKKKTETLKEVSTDATYFKFSSLAEGEAVNMRIDGFKSFKKNGKDVDAVVFETKAGKFINASTRFVQSVKEVKAQLPFFIRVVYIGTTTTDNGEMDDLKVYTL
jgi:hypothetical protein